MNQKIFLLILIVPVAVFGQKGANKDSVKENRSAYIKIGIGSGSSSFRDKATSPLFYRGPGFSGVLSTVKFNERRESNFEFNFIVGRNVAEVAERQMSSSFFSSYTFKYARLYRLRGWTDKTWNYKAGGTALLTANVRNNSSLQNNSFGYEGFVNLMGSFKISRDISRRMEKDKKLLFIRYTLRPRKRILSYQFDVGLWNNSHRNGYAYISQSNLINDWQVFDGYTFDMFSGLRFSAELNYTFYLIRAPNNAVQISYVWDALRTEGGSDAFAMAYHLIRVSLLYNTKK